MGMVHYAEKTVFTAGKNAGEKESKEEQVDESWKPKISLVSTPKKDWKFCHELL